MLHRVCVFRRGGEGCGAARCGRGSARSLNALRWGSLRDQSWRVRSTGRRLSQSQSTVALGDISVSAARRRRRGRRRSRLYSGLSNDADSSRRDSDRWHSGTTAEDATLAARNSRNARVGRVAMETAGRTKHAHLSRVPIHWVASDVHQWSQLLVSPQRLGPPSVAFLCIV